LDIFEVGIGGTNEYDHSGVMVIIRGKFYRGISLIGLG